MSRKQLIKPHLAIGQRQRIRMANIVDKISNIDVQNYEKMSQNTPLQDKQLSKDKIYITGSGEKKKRKRVFGVNFNYSESLRRLDEEKRAQNLTLRLGLNQVIFLYFETIYIFRIQYNQCIHLNMMFSQVRFKL